MRRHAARCALLGGLVAAASASSAPAVERVRAQHTVVQCPLAGPVDRALLRVFDNAAQWRAELAAGERELFRHGIQWGAERVVVFALEQQPTLGVSVDLDTKNVAVRRKSLVLPVRIRRPGPGELAASALSRPCLIAVVDRDGWTRALVTGAKGRVLSQAGVSTDTPNVGGAPQRPDLSEVMKPAAPAR